MEEYAAKKNKFIAFFVFSGLVQLLCVGYGVLQVVKVDGFYKDRSRLTGELNDLTCSQLCPQTPIPQQNQCCNTETCRSKQSCQTQKIIALDDQIHNGYENEIGILFVIFINFCLIMYVYFTFAKIRREAQEAQWEIMAQESSRNRLGEFQNIRARQIRFVGERPRGDTNIAQSFLGREDVASDFCSICMESLNRSKIIQLPRCVHMFHSNCIRRWCRTNASCPVCRENIYDAAIHE